MRRRTGDPPCAYWAACAPTFFVAAVVLKFGSPFSAFGQGLSGVASAPVALVQNSEFGSAVGAVGRDTIGGAWPSDGDLKSETPPKGVAPSDYTFVTEFVFGEPKRLLCFQANFLEPERAPVLATCSISDFCPDSFPARCYFPAF